MGKFALKALTGPVKGHSFPLGSGLRIGRVKGDIVLKDPSVSDPHAEIKVSSKGEIVIIDKDSKNGILVDNRETEKSTLKKGSKFKIGKTEFELVFILTPREILSSFIKKHSKNIKDQPLRLKPFIHEIELIFTAGLQKGERHLLLYGPRFCGSRSADLPLLDKKAPEKAFSLIPHKEKSLFITEHPSEVKLNGKEIEKASLKEGDKIFIGHTVLQILLK